MKWKEVIEEFDIYMKVEHPLAPVTRDMYMARVKEFIAYCRPRAIRPETADHYNIRAYLRKQRHVEAGTLNNIHKAIRQMFRMLQLRKVIEKSPCDGLSYAKVISRVPRTLDVWEINMMVESLSGCNASRDKAIIETLYGSGLRLAELCGMDLESINWQEGLVKVIGKGDKERLVPMSSASLTAIDEYMHTRRLRVLHKVGVPTQALFLSNKGGRITPDAVQGLIRSAAKGGGIMRSINPHVFRHTFATHLLQGGANLRDVQDMLGHESINTTSVYLHANVDYLRKNLMMSHPRAHVPGVAAGAAVPC